MEISEEIQPMHYYQLHFFGRLLSFCSVLLCASLLPSSLLAQCDFQEVASAQNITHTFNGGLLASGVSFMDFDGDGWDDLSFGTSEGELVEIYKNNQGTFEKVTLNGISNTCDSKQITWVDFDNDGDKDLFYTCAGDNVVLYRNNGNLNFTEMATDMGLNTAIGSSMGANWADFDRDGYLDLYITYYGLRNQLFRNIGGLSFENVTMESNVATSVKPTFCGVVFDYDNNGWEDIYLANDRSTKNDLIKSLGPLNFQDAGAGSGSDLAMDAMGTTLLDMNRDGYFEVYISNSPKGNALIYNNRDGTFTDIAQSSGTIFNGTGWGVNTLDFDNDTFWDIYVSGSDVGSDIVSSVLYRAKDTSSFELTDFKGMAADTLSSFSNAVGDFNRDGRMDIAVSNANGDLSQLWQNSCTDDNHWIKVKPQGTVSNRDGIGSRVIAYAGGVPLYQYVTGGTSFMAQNTDYVHFGLAQNTKVDSLFVEWPSGLIDQVFDPAINQMITIVEGSKPKPLPVIASVDPSTLCEGDKFTLSVDIQIPGAEVKWSNSIIAPSIEVSNSNTFYATITTSIGVFYTEQLVADMNEYPEVSVTKTDVTATELGTITITESDGPYNYRWSHDSKETGNSLTGLEAGAYQVEIRTDAGCLLTVNVTIEEEFVTSLDEAQIKDISYQRDDKHLTINIPEELRPQLRESRVTTLSGREIHHKSHTKPPQGNILIPIVEHGRVLFIDLVFTNDRVVKKLLFVND